MSSEMHLKCITDWLSRQGFVDFTRNDSNYSYMFFLGDKVIKIRKPYSTVLGRVKPFLRKELAHKEFLRGKEIEHTSYIGVEDIPCKRVTNMCCNSALFIRRYPANSRLDIVIRSGKIAPEELINLLVSRITRLIKMAPIVTDYDIVGSLLKGNYRLINNLSTLNSMNTIDTKDMLDLWEEINKKTIENSDTFKKRLQKGRVKRMHGDLCFKNIFYFRKRLYLLDPAVASDDMNILDISAEIGALLVELNINGLSDNILWRSHSKLRELDLNEDLVNYFAIRYAMIRATVSCLTLAYKKNIMPALRYESNSYLNCVRGWLGNVGLD